MRYVQRMAASVVALTAGTLIVFGTVKGTTPSGAAVPYILAGVLACSAAVWLTVLPLGKAEERAKSLQVELNAASSDRDTVRGERDALKETNETVRTERDQARGELRHLTEQAEVAGRPRLPAVIRNRVIELSDLPPWVTNRTFEDCELVGPGPALISPSERERCTLLGIDETTFLIQDDFSKLPPGTVRFIKCNLVGCEFQSLAFVGNTAQMAGLRQEFRENRV
jgi:hypothetical protein